MATCDRKRPARKIAIVQSNYIPWKGYFDLIAGVDEFVLLDDVQYTPRNWRNRNQIKTPSGPRWLTIPVHSKGHRQRRIDETRIVDHAWARSHWSAIEQAYGRAPCFAASAEVLAPAYHEASTLDWLSEVNHLLLRRVCEMLGIETTISWSRDYEYEQTDPSERLLAICLAAGASQYVSGPSARAYLDVGMFERAGVSVAWFDYSGYPEYRQPHGAFIHHVSVVDLLCCAGISSRGLLKSTRDQPVAPT